MVLFVTNLRFWVQFKMVSMRQKKPIMCSTWSLRSFTKDFFESCENTTVTSASTAILCPAVCVIASFPLLFIGKEQSNMAEPWGAQTGSKKVLLLYKCWQHHQNAVQKAEVCDGLPWKGEISHTNTGIVLKTTLEKRMRNGMEHILWTFLNALIPSWTEWWFFVLRDCTP